MRSTPKMKVMPAETRNSQDANTMPSIRMIGRIFMRIAPQCHFAPVERRQAASKCAQLVSCSPLARKRWHPLCRCAPVRRRPSSRKAALALFPSRPAFDPLDRLLALRRGDIGGGEDAELVEDRITELGVLLTRGEAPHCLVHRLMILAHENPAARCVELEAFHRSSDLLVARPAP